MPTIRTIGLQGELTEIHVAYQRGSARQHQADISVGIRDGTRSDQFGHLVQGVLPDIEQIVGGSTRIHRQRDPAVQIRHRFQHSIHLIREGKQVRIDGGTGRT